MTDGTYCSRIHGFDNRASRLAKMRAIVVMTVAKIGFHFREIMLKVFRINPPQPNFSNARGVCYLAAKIKRKELNECGCVLALFRFFSRPPRRASLNRVERRLEG